MMISPETFYEMNLKGKTAAEIMSVICSLKQKIGRLKNIVEHPNYTCTIHPSKRVQLYCLQDYLDRSKQALVEAGSNYVPSATEKRAMEFDANIPYINKVVFSIGGFLEGYATKTYTVEGDMVSTYVEHSLILKPANFNDSEIEKFDKEYLLESLKNLRIGEWRKNYDTLRFGISICDGTQWGLEIYFSNGHKPVKISGDNAYPYNFERLLDLFEIE